MGTRLESYPYQVNIRRYYLKLYFWLVFETQVSKSYKNIILKPQSLY